MTQTKTKKALLMSVLSMMLCVAMLVGMTFAWFTDTASTSVNKIQAGKLDVELLMRDGEGKYQNIGDSQQVIFGSENSLVAQNNNQDTLWEPGKTQVAYLAVRNAGNLALKYNIVLDIVDNGLAGALKYVIVPQGKKIGEGQNFNERVDDWNTLKNLANPLPTGRVTAAEKGCLDEIARDSRNVDETEYFALVIHMDENAGNTYQGKDVTIDLKVVATQKDAEADSNGTNYDKDAPLPLIVTQRNLNQELTLDAIPEDTTTGKHAPVEVTLGNTEAADISYSEVSSGYTGKGVMLGSTKLNRYGVRPEEVGKYSFTFKDGTITSAASGYSSIDNFKDTSVYMLLPSNSDVVFENMTFNGAVSFDIQKYTSPWSNLNSLKFKNCTFNGIIIGTCPASNVTFDGCKFNTYTNTTSANNSNPIWWREDTEGSGANANPIKTFTFVNNEVTGTRPVKIERIGKTVSPVFTIKNNEFNISRQTSDTVTKNMAINIGMGENPNLPFTLIDEGNTISSNTAALYTASLTGGSNWYKEKSGMKVLDGNGNKKVIKALVWKTTTGETFEIKSID